jgi:hypothetical protein
MKTMLPRRAYLLKVGGDPFPGVGGDLSPFVALEMLDPPNLHPAEGEIIVLRPKLDLSVNLGPRGHAVAS